MALITKEGLVKLGFTSIEGRTNYCELIFESHDIGFYWFYDEDGLQIDNLSGYQETGIYCRNIKYINEVEILIKLIIGNDFIVKNDDLTGK